MFLEMTDLICDLSSELVSLSPAVRHCLTAASQLLREKINVIAGSRPSRSSFSTISDLLRDFGPFGLSRQFPLT